MSLFKRRYLVLLILTTVLIGTWMARIPLIELLAISMLDRFGLSATDTEISQIGFRQSEFSHLSFNLATDKGRMRLEAYDASIAYELDQLTDGRIAALVIHRLVIDYSSLAQMNGQPSADDALEPVKLVASLRRAMREYVIFDTFQVQNLVFSGEAFGALQNQPFKLTGTNVDAVTTAGLTLVEKTDNPRRLVITHLSDSRLSANLKLSDQPDKQPAAVNININDAYIDGNYSIDPVSLGYWMEPLIQLKRITQKEMINGSVAIKFDTGDDIRVRLAATTGKLETAAYKAENIDIELVLNTPVASSFKLVEIENGSVIKADAFSYEDYLFKGAPIHIDGRLSNIGDTWKYDGEISTAQLAVQSQPHTLKLDDVTVRISADPEHLKSTGNAATANVPGRFAFSLEHSFATQSGKLAVRPQQPIDLSAGDYRLSQLLTPWPYPFDLLTGSLKLSTNASWKKAQDFRLATRIALDDAGGNYGELVFSGLTLDHELEVLPDLRSKRASTIRLLHLDSGVTASNLSTGLMLLPADYGNLPKLRITDLYGEIFDGSFTGEDFIYDPNKAVNRFKISAENIDLAKIVETQQLDDITVTGRIDGTIPVEINDKGVFIEHGAFINVVRDGTIRYNPAAGTDQLRQNPLTGIALDALRDFHYSHLSADVNYQPEGTLSINLKLKGTSPELETTRPVHLNINTEQNLLSLLKSLRLAEGISANIDRKVRQQYDESRSNH